VKPEEVPRLGPDGVHLWYAPSDDSEEAEACRRQLSPQELERYERLLLPETRRRFAVAHALVRRALSAYADVAPGEWRFSAGPHGKPEIAASADLPPLRFNLSRSSGLCACAVTLGRDIGVDVERSDRRAEITAIARRFFAPEEAADVEAHPERFFEYWTLKEAFVKACGRGLSMPLRDAPSLSEQPSGWRFFRDAPSPRHLCAVAVRNKDGADLSLAILR